MGRKPNAAEIAHALALLGGGAKKYGGDGMLGGIRNIFETGIRHGMNTHQRMNEQVTEEFIKQIEVKDN